MTSRYEVINNIDLNLRSSMRVSNEPARRNRIKWNVKTHLTNKRDPFIPADIIPTFLEYLNTNRFEHLCEKCGDLFDIRESRDSFWCELTDKHYHRSCESVFLRELRLQNDDSIVQQFCGDVILVGNDEIQSKLGGINNVFHWDKKAKLHIDQIQMDVFYPKAIVSRSCEKHTGHPNKFYWCCFHRHFECKNCIGYCSQSHNYFGDGTTNFFNDYGVYLFDEDDSSDLTGLCDVCGSVLVTTRLGISCDICS